MELEIKEIFRIADLVRKCSGEKTIGSKHIDTVFEIQFSCEKNIKEKCIKNCQNPSNEYDYNLFLNKLKCINPNANKTCAFYLAPFCYDAL